VGIDYDHRSVKIAMTFKIADPLSTRKCNSQLLTRWRDWASSDYRCWVCGRDFFRTRTTHFYRNW